MWSKIPIFIVATVVLMVICIPVTAHDGRMLDRIEDPLDEHPWGGDHYDGGNPNLQATALPDFSIQWSGFYLSMMAVDYYYMSIRHLIVNVANDEVDGNTTGTGATATVPDGSTTNPNSGARN